MPKRTLRTLAAATLLAAAALTAGTGKATASTGVKVVIDHVDNPRGLALRPGGQLYVAAAGKAGSFCPAPDSCGGLTSPPCPRISACPGCSRGAPRSPRQWAP